MSGLAKKAHGFRRTRPHTKKRHARSVALSEAKLLRSLLERVPDYLFIKDTDSRFLVANPAVADDLGLAVSDLIGKTDFDIHPRERAEKFFSDEQDVMRSGNSRIDIEEFVLTASGQRKWLATSKLPLRNDKGEVIGLVGVCRNITERRNAELALIESENRWSFALEGAGQGVWDHNLTEGTAYFSPTWRRMRGIGLEEAVDPSRDAWLSRVHPDDRLRLLGETDQQNAGSRQQNSFEYRELHRDGHYIWILSRGKPVEWTSDGRVARIIGTDTDISSLKAAEAKAAEEKEETYRKHLAALEKAQLATEAAHQLAQSMARHDPLTGLPNRRVFAEHLQTAVARASRGGTVSYAVLIIDLDRFKPVNDLHGHAVGDEVLREIASRLREISRGSDTVARLGGDEFGIILECSGAQDPAAVASGVADRLISSLALPVAVRDQHVQVGASIGIAMCPHDGADPDTLMRAADMAMYRAKEEGRDSFRFFQHSMEKALREKIALEENVRLAVVREEIRPYYQPLVRLAENRLVGFEILARWHDPERGEVEPDVFIPIVEKLGLIGELTYQLLRRACIDAQAWPAHVSISLNVSPLQLSDSLLPVKILSILSATGLSPGRLEIEVTETAFARDADAARATVLALQSLGIRISLDDFGTGYSNLHNLRDLHFDKIKIDRSFVVSIGSDDGSEKIVGSVINLARSLGLPVIAEGIENRGAMEEVLKYGGEYGQGFLFGKAVPASEAAAIASSHMELKSA